MSSIDTPTSGLTYDDLRRFPDDNVRREIIDGQLIVGAAPGTRHQRAVLAVVRALVHYQDEHGGQAYPAPTDVYFAADTVVEPDAVFVTAAHADRSRRRSSGALPIWSWRSRPVVASDRCRPQAALVRT